MTKDRCIHEEDPVWSHRSITSNTHVHQEIHSSSTLQLDSKPFLYWFYEWNILRYRALECTVQVHRSSKFQRWVDPNVLGPMPLSYMIQFGNFYSEIFLLFEQFESRVCIRWQGAKGKPKEDWLLLIPTWGNFSIGVSQISTLDFILSCILMKMDKAGLSQFQVTCH